MTFLHTVHCSIDTVIDLGLVNCAQVKVFHKTAFSEVVRSINPHKAISHTKHIRQFFSVTNHHARLALFPGHCHLQSRLWSLVVCTEGKGSDFRQTKGRQRVDSMPKNRSQSPFLLSAVDSSIYNMALIPYSGKLSREKTFMNFMVLWLFAKVFSTKFGGMASFGAAKVSNPQKFSLRKSYFSPIHESFFASKVSRYKVVQNTIEESTRTVNHYHQAPPPFVYPPSTCNQICQYLPIFDHLQHAKIWRRRHGRSTTLH